MLGLSGKSYGQTCPPDLTVYGEITGLISCNGGTASYEYFISPTNLSYACPGPNRTFTLFKDQAFTGTPTCTPNIFAVVQTIGPTNNTFVSFTGLFAGNYVVMVSNANGYCGQSAVPQNGCGESKKCFTVVQPSLLVISPSIGNPLLCSYSTNGIINVSASGGTSPYNVSWRLNLGSWVDPLPIAELLSAGSYPIGNLGAGSYEIKITDANGCVKTETVPLNTPPAINLAHTKTNLGCNGLNNGSINITASGGTPFVSGNQYTYSWAGPNSFTATTEDVNNLAAGNYTVTVTDANNCTKEQGITISEPTPVVGSVVSTTPLSCTGIPNGTATLTVSGGVPPYTLSRSGSASQIISSAGEQATFTGLPAGNLSFFVLDASGCKDTIFVTLTEPPALNIILIDTNVSCYGYTDGRIGVEVSGGTPQTTTPNIGYNISWTGGGSSFIPTPNINDISGVYLITNLAPGSYTVTVIDGNNCQNQASVVISQPPNILLSTSISQTACFDDSTGAINLTVLPQPATNPPYSFLWSGPGLYSNNTEDISGVPGGIYTVEVRDAFNCLAVFPNLIVPQPPQLTLTSQVSQEICYDPTPGAIDITVNGGTPGYFYSWSGSGIPSTLLGAQDQSNLLPGIYNLTVIDQNGCQILDTWQIEPSPPLLTIIEIHTDPLCHDDANGSITVTVNGGTPIYTITAVDDLGVAISGPIIIATGPNSHTYTGLTAGSYTITVTDINGCDSSITILLVNPLDITLSASTTPVSCFGGNDGTITFTASGGTGTLNYFTTPASSSGAVLPGNNPISNLSEGIYILTITDQNGCQKNITVDVDEPEPFTLTGIPSQVDCYALNAGAIDITVGGGTPVYNYNWTGPNSFTSSSPDLSGLAPGIYTLTLTDDNGCDTTASWQINPPPPLLTIIEIHTDPLCHDDANGSITVTVNGGTPIYTITAVDDLSLPISGPIIIPTAPNSHTYTGLTAGSYTITVTDINGCDSSITILLVNPLDITLSASTTPVSCFGGNDGTIVFNASGGTGALSYSTVPASSIGTVIAGSNTISNLSAGFYTLIITDTNGCQDSIIVEVLQPTALVLTETITNVNCNGAANGGVTVLASGGTAPYTYNWSTPGGTTPNISNLGPGSYTLTVTDANNCTFSETYTISEPPVLNLEADITDAINCFGGTAIITATVAGGTANYTLTGIGSPVILTPPNLTHTYTVLAGTYTITATDAKGCVEDTIIVVSQPAFLTLNATATPIACNGGTTTALLIPIGGTPSYTFTGSPTLTLGPGVYNYTVTDANGCSANASLTITAPSQIVASVILTTPIQCSGGQAVVTVSATGGTLPYSGTGSFTVFAGTHTFIVTDANGCADNVSITVTQPNLLTATANIIAPILCNGGQGVIQVIASGGSPIYAGIGNFNVGAGTYTYIVTDANGCTAQDVINITEPTPIVVSAVLISPILCNGETGQVTVTATGGTPGYTGTGVFNVTAGTSQVFPVVDANGCPGSATLTITEPTLLIATASVNGPILCNNGTTTVTVTASGGTPNYSGTGTFTVAEGPYSFTVTDANGCTTIVAGTIAEPSAIVVNATPQQITCFGANNGSITPIVTGGTPSYIYAWTASNGGIISTSTTASNISGLVAGTYTLTVIDANGCDTTVSWQINPAPPLLTIIEIHADPLCHDDANGSITVTVNGGTPQYILSGIDVPVIIATGPNSHTYTGLTAGSYTITVTDINGCDSSITILLVNPLDITLSASTTPVSCFGGNDGTIVFNASGGTGALSYSTVPASSIGTVIAGSNTISNLSAGFYTLIITDTNGCQDSIIVKVLQPTALVLTETITNVNCNGAANGGVTVLASGGTAPYTYNWSTPGGTTPNISNLGPGSYTLTVTDANNCTFSETYTISEPPVLNLEADITDAINCFGGTAIITATVAGGTANYTLTGIGSPVILTPPNLTHTYTVLAGTYTITATDAKGCVEDTIIVVSQPAFLTLNATATPIACNGGTTTALLIPIGGTPSYTFTGSPTLTLGPGVYNYTVTDANGCSANASLTITAPSQIVASVILTTPIQCSGGQAVVTVSATGGTLPYSGTGSFTVFAGTHTFIVTDANGCADNVSITVTQPNLLTATANIIAPILCNGGQGVIQVIASGGSPIYAGIGNFNVGAGTYTYIVTDANGCTAQDVINITEPTPIVVSAVLISPILCNGETGQVTVTATGGTPGYTGTGVFNVTAGTSQVFPVVDANGCPGSATLTITEPTLLIATASVNGPILCNNGTTTVTVTASGGTPNYSGTGTFTVAEGPYSFTVTDANGCTTIVAGTIAEPSAIVVNATPQQITCFGANNGSITPIVTGGTPSYIYAWTASNGGIISTSTTASNISGLVAGTYTLTVIDANGCDTTVSWQINPAPPLLTIIEIHADPLCHDDANGSITVTVNGGTPQYILSGIDVPVIIATGPNSHTYTGLTAGSYTITVTDINGCDSSITILLVNPLDITLSASTTPVSCFGGNDGTIVFNASGGTGALSYSTVPASSIGTVIAGSNTISNLSAGFYTLIITDTNGCQDSIIVEVLQPTALVLTETITNVNCNGAANGGVTVLASGGTAPYTYNWSTPGGTTPNISNLGPGSYTLTVTDANNCTFSETYTISEPPVLNLEADITDAINCFGGTAIITATVAGGTANYTLTGIGSPVILTPPNLTHTYTVLAGTYTITATDAKGCVEDTIIVVSQPAFLTLNATATPIACNGGTTTALLIPIGGTPSYTFTGSPTLTLGPGVYNYTVTDANGCSANASLTITAPSQIVASVILTTPIQCSGGQAVVTVSATGGTLPYSGTGSFTVFAGTHTFIVTDANGCADNVSITVTQPNLLTATANIIAPILCNGGQGVIQVIASGGSPIYAGIGNFNVGAGTYTYVVTDANGCTAQDVITITEPTPIVVSAVLTSPILCNGETGQVTVTATGGTPGYTGTGVFNVTAGTSQVFPVVDANGCPGSATLTITEPTLLIATASVNGPILCNNGTTTVTVTASGGTPNYSGTGTFTVAEGPYSFTVTDANGCTTIVAGTIAEPSAIVVNATPQQITCFGANNGSITPIVTGGTPSYIYAWTASNGGIISTSTTASNISGLVAGTYTLTVIDANGCDTTVSWQINPAPPLLTIIEIHADPLCHDDANGSITVTVNGGTPQYILSGIDVPVIIATGPNSHTYTGLTAGSYTITVTDANGCDSSITILLVNPLDITLSASTTPVSCFGGNDGTISFTVTGGTNPFNYWTSPATASGIINPGVSLTIGSPMNPASVPAGNYKIYVLSGNSCLDSIEVIVGFPSPIVISWSDSGPLCDGTSLGYINIIPSGGTPNSSPPYYQTLWSWAPLLQGIACLPTPIPNNSLNPSSLTCGVYTVTVTDGNGCTAQYTDSIIITPTPFQANFTGTDILCFNETNGTITVQPTTGVGPFNVVITPSSGPMIDPAGDEIGTVGGSYIVGSLSPGNYSVLITDANGCTDSDLITIDAPDNPITATVISPENISCFDEGDGEFTVSIIGGTAPYTISVTPAGEATFSIISSGVETISNLNANTYSIVVSDVNNCSSGVIIQTINEPLELTIEDTILPAKCYNEPGSILITVNGGTPSYNYSWVGPGITSSNLNNEDQINVIPGIYSVTVTDMNGCVKNASWQIDPAPPLLTIIEIHADPLCHDDANGSITVTVNGGTPIYTITGINGPVIIATGPNSHTYTGLTAGSYTITVTDINGCDSSITILLVNPLDITLSASTTPDSCFGGNDGTIVFNASGGTGALSYSTVPASSIGTVIAGSNTISNLSAGFYTLIITDTNGCQDSIIVEVLQPTALVLTETITNVNCNGAANGGVTVLASGGTAPYTYNWSTPGGTTPNISNLGPGSYTLTVTDANNCTFSETYTISEPPVLNLEADITDAINCFGGTAIITATVAGGTANYTLTGIGSPVILTPPNLTHTYTVLAGTYTITATDAKGCVEDTIIVVSQPAFLTLNATATPIACNGGTTTALLIPIGGTPSYTFTGSPTLTLGPGVYNYTVTDANGCSANASLTITAPSQIVASVILTTPIQCSGGQAVVTVSATGGTLPYSGTGSFTVFAGTHTFIVTDANGCADNVSITVTQPNLLTATANIIAPILCNGGQGVIQVIASGGTPIYAGIGNFNVGAGTYTYIVTDANGCTAQDVITITEPTPIVVSAVLTSPILCNGETGQVTVTATGGTPGYTGTGVFNVTAGTSQVFPVVDANGCPGSATLTITEPTLLIATASVNGPILCNNGTTTVTVTASGGTPNYSGTGTFSVAEGPYSFTVTDANGCTTIVAGTIAEPSAIVVNATPQQITCFGANNGSITPIVTGGTPSYIYAWTASNGGIISTSPTASNISGLIAGTYGLTVTDNNGCITNGAWQIDPAPPLLVITETHTDPDCHNDENGSITVTVNGGTPGYTITRSGSPVIIATGPNSHTYTGLTAGNYTITVTDANGCDSSITILLENPLDISLSASTTPVSCFGGNNGTIVFSASGGTGTLSYSTFPATTSGPVVAGNNTISNLSAGSYILTITDQNGCDSIITVTITEPEPISFDSISSNINCYGENNGAIVISNIIGGTPAYSYLWTGPSITVSTSTITSQSNLAPGLYTFKVTDANGCFKQLSWNITQPLVPLNIDLSSLTNNSCYGFTDGSVLVSATGGIPGYQIEYQRITPSGILVSPVGIEIPLSGGSYIINDLSAGDYEFTVTDANGCSVDSTFSILSPPEFVATVSSNSILCNPPNNTGEIIITTPPGSYPVTYFITSPSSSAPIIGAIITSPHTILNLPGGTYDIVLTYNSGLCSQNLSTTIEPASPLVFDSSIVNNISCYGENDGSICVYVSGGATPYTYSWSIPGTSSCQVSLAPGQYTFTVTDANGCSIQYTYTINAPATPLIASADSTAVLCFGEDDGTITVTVSGGSPNYTLTSPTLNPPNAIIALSGGSYIYPNVSSGTHDITVTDANGCDTTFSVTIGSPTSLPSITGLAVQNILCFEDLNTGGIDFNIIGGTAPYILTWLNSPTGCPAPATIITSSAVSVTALCKGSYTLLITDANGCSINNFIINITAPTAPLSVVTSQTNNLCFGDCDGIATSVPSGGTPYPPGHPFFPYQYSWNTGPTIPLNTATLSSLCIEDYYNTITDANGCFIIAQFSITAPAQPITVSETHLNVDCFDNATGSILVSAFGGTPGYNISWLPVPPNPTSIIEIPASGDTYNITGLLAGLYDITITDLNNCVVVIDNIPITQPAEMTYAIAHSNITCFGANDGSITLDVNGGVVDGSGEYASYIWSSTDVVAPCIIPINEISPSGLCPGEYTVVVTDWNGCTITTSATIIEPDLLTNTVQQTDVLCFGDNTGSASVFVLGGTPFATGNQYLYSWTGPASFVSGNQTINNLGVGQYNVLVTDANGCTTNNVVNIIMATSALTAIGNSTPVSCFNGTNGTAIITASNGTAPYVVTGITVPFSGNIPISGGSISMPNLSAGTYDFSITDANLCETILTIVVTTPPLLTASGIVSNQLCFVPLCTGSITTNVAGGTPAVIGNDYIYVWTSTSTSIPVGANPAGLCVGTYTLVVSDMNGCNTAPQTFSITSPTILESTISAVNVTTFGAATGAIDLTVTGGVSPYAYNWEVSFDGGTTWVPTTLPGVQDQNNLPAGLYQVTITDANGCTTSDAVTIEQPSSGITATPIIIPVGCFGDLSGGINLGVSGGSGSYSYQWNGPGASMPNTNQNQSNLGAGSYTVIITDNVTNAFGTYTYVITQPASALVIGTPVFVLIPNPVNPPCSNQYTITAPAAGGTAPYDYYWFNTSGVLLFNGPSYTGSAGDVFILNVYDANDCFASIPISLPNPFRIEVDFEITGICNDLLSGVSIGTIVSGGLPGYNYSWSPGIVPSGVIPPGQSNLPSLSNIGSGWYDLTITDQCGSTLDTFVFVPPIQPALILNAVASVNAGCTDATGLITVTATNGYVPYDVEWQGIGGTIGSGNPVGTEISSSGGSYSINNLSSGNYAITLTDSYGCSADTTVFIDNIDPVVPNFSISNILCNTTNVTFTNTTAPNTPGLIWDWQFSDGQSSNEENPTLIFSTPGLITVILTATDTTGFASGSNDNGCVFVGLSQTITILEVPNASFIASPQEISGFSGEVTFVNTSINADSYIWNFGDGNGSNQESPVHQFVAGDTEYTVTLTAISINGCTDDTSIIIRLTNPLVLWVPNTFTPNYNDNNEVFLPIFSDPSLVREYKLLIFNRWGEIVFESNDIEVGWDGYYKQMGQYGVQKVQDGTYIWQIRYIDAYSVTHNEKGHINVLK